MEGGKERRKRGDIRTTLNNKETLKRNEVSRKSVLQMVKDDKFSLETINSVPYSLHNTMSACLPVCIKLECTQKVPSILPFTSGLTIPSFDSIYQTAAATV